MPLVTLVALKAPRLKPMSLGVWSDHLSPIRNRLLFYIMLATWFITWARSIDTSISSMSPMSTIPGNHDGATGSSGAQSLEGFRRNFCASKGVYTKESMDTQRMAMFQPYVYWCFDTPLAYF